MMVFGIRLRAASAEVNLVLKKRKKLEPTSIARPADSASSTVFAEVMPREPSAEGQLLCWRINTGRASHQIAGSYSWGECSPFHRPELDNGIPRRH